MLMESLQHRGCRCRCFAVGSASHSLQQLFGVLEVAGVQHCCTGAGAPIGGITGHGVICRDDRFRRRLPRLRLPNGSAGLGFVLPRYVMWRLHAGLSMLCMRQVYHALEQRLDESPTFGGIGKCPREDNHKAHE